jgi:hypothetical protein
VFWISSTCLQEIHAYLVEFISTFLSLSLFSVSAFRFPLSAFSLSRFLAYSISRFLAYSISRLLAFSLSRFLSLVYLKGTQTKLDARQITKLFDDQLRHFWLDVALRANFLCNFFFGIIHVHFVGVVEYSEFITLRKGERGRGKGERRGGEGRREREGERREGERQTNLKLDLSESMTGFPLMCCFAACVSARAKSKVTFLPCPYRYGTSAIRFRYSTSSTFADSDVC